LAATLEAEADAPVSPAAAPSSHPPPVNELVVTIQSCSGLHAREGVAPPSPFVTYRLAGVAEYLTV
jgi:hypothetical protein